MGVENVGGQRRLFSKTTTHVLIHRVNLVAINKVRTPVLMPTLGEGDENEKRVTGLEWTEGAAWMVNGHFSRPIQNGRSSKPPVVISVGRRVGEVHKNGHQVTCVGGEAEVTHLGKSSGAVQRVRKSDRSAPSALLPQWEGDRVEGGGIKHCTLFQKTMRGCLEEMEIGHQRISFVHKLHGTSPTHMRNDKRQGQETSPKSHLAVLVACFADWEGATRVALHR